MRNLFINLLIVILLVLFILAVCQVISCRQPPEIVREPVVTHDCCKDAESEAGGSATPPVPDAAPTITTPQFGSVLVVVRIDDQEYTAICGGEVTFVPSRALLKLQRTP